MLNYFIEYNRYLNIIGIIVISAIALLFSKNRRAINIRLLVCALALHFAFAFGMLRTHWGRVFVGGIASAAEKIYLFADKGIEFMFGKLGDANLPWGFIFAFKVLPVIIFVGALTALLYHWDVIQKLVVGLNWVIRPLLGTSGVETMSAIANSILGQTEAALFMSNYIHVMTTLRAFCVDVQWHGGNQYFGFDNLCDYWDSGSAFAHCKCDEYSGIDFYCKNFSA